MNFNITTKNLAMVIIGMVITIALGMLAREQYVLGSLELVFASVMFWIINNTDMEGGKK
jgi:hypothetical protein